MKKYFILSVIFVALLALFILPHFGFTFTSDNQKADDECKDECVTKTIFGSGGETPHPIAPVLGGISALSGADAFSADGVYGLEVDTGTPPGPGGTSGPVTPLHAPVTSVSADGEESEDPEKDKGVVVFVEKKDELDDFAERIENYADAACVGKCNKDRREGCVLGTYDGFGFHKLELTEIFGLLQMRVTPPPRPRKNKKTGETEEVGAMGYKMVFTDEKGPTTYAGAESGSFNPPPKSLIPAAFRTFVLTGFSLNPARLQCGCSR